MKVCIALSRFFPRYYGGMINAALNVGQALRQLGHDVWILTTEEDRGPGGELMTRDDHDGLMVMRIWLGHLQLDPDSRLVDFEPEIGQIVQGLLLQTGTDLLHIWNFATLTTAVVPAAHAIDVPVVFQAVDYGATCWRYTLVRWDGSLCDGRETLMHCLDCFRPWSKKSELMYRSLKVMGEPMRDRFIDLADRTSLPKPWLLGRAEKLHQRLQEHRSALLSVDHVIVASNWVREILMRNGFPASQITLSPHGIDPLPRLPKSPASQVRFGFLGRLEPVKGVHIAIDAFRRLARPDGATLTVFGRPETGNERYCEELLRLAEGFPGIRFAGYIAASDVPNAMQHIDVMVVPSVWHEPFGLVSIEALATGTPIIASSSGGTRDIVQDNINGFLFAPGDVVAVRDLMQRCIDEPVLRHRLAQAIQPWRTVSEEAMQVQAVYQSALESRLRATARYPSSAQFTHPRPS